MKSIINTPLGIVIIFLGISIIISISVKIFGHAVLIGDGDYLLFAVPTLIILLWVSYAKHTHPSKKKLSLNITTVIGIGAICIAIILHIIFMVYPFQVLPTYRRAKEPISQRIFVVKSVQHMFNRGYAQLYEVHGPFMKKIEGEYYSGEFLMDKPSAYISDDGKKIIIAFFFMNPVFSVPLQD